MYRGRPHRGEYPRSYGPPPGAHSRAPHRSHSPPGSGRHMPSGPYRDDRERHGYHHGYPDDYRRSPPRRRYPSPGSSSYRGPSSEYRGNGPPPREQLSKRHTPSPSRGDMPVDHSLVITVGNELTGSQPPRSSRNSEHHYERDYHNRHPSDTRSGYERPSEERYKRRSPSQGRSRPRSRSRSRGRGRSRSRSQGKSRGRSKSRVRSRSRSRGRSPSRSRGKSRGRSKSRARSQSRSRSRGRSRAREKSRSRSGSSSSSSSSSSGSPSPNLKRKDEFRELELARRRKELEEMLGAPTKSILKKRVDSETDSPVALQSGDSPALGPAEPQSSSLSRETERFLSAVSKGMEAGLFATMLGDMGEQPHDQQAQASGHGLNLSQYEEILSMVKREADGDRIEELLLPHEQVRQDSGGFSRILGLMGNLPDPQEKRKSFADIEDEEKFLYGDGDENEGDKEKIIAQSPTVTPTRGTQLHSQPELSPYGESRPEIAKYHDSKLGMAQYYDRKPEVPEYSGGQQFVQRSLSETHEPLREAYAGTVDSTYRHSSAAPEDRLDAGVPRASHQQVQPEVRYRRHSQPVATTGQNNNSHVGMPQKQSEPDQYLPGLDPREAKERQEVAEYERIQDLLKTIGLDLGVAEISKMAARTQERLHGKKPPTAASRRMQERRTSSANYDRRKSHSSTSSSGSSRSPSRSRSRSRGRGRSRGRSRKRTPDTERRSVSPRPTRLVSLGESLADSGKSDLEVKVEDKSWGIPVLGKGTSQPRITVTMNPPPNLSSMPQSMPAMGPHAIQAMAGYQGQTPGYPMPPPNYPPPGYGQFEGYMPYMPPGWPMYPPPSMLPPQSPVEDVPVSGASSRPYLRVIETVPTETKDSRSSQTASKSEASASKPDPEDRFASQDAKEEISQSQRLSEEKNKASQRDKVIEEKEKLKKERDVRMKKKEYLMKELERLRKQQGELLRKKRRERDGHKDPLLAELGRLQEEVMVQISKLRKEHVEAEQKRVELDKVLLILGKDGSDKHRRGSRPSRDHGEPPSSERTSAKPPATTTSASVPSAKVASAFEPIPEKLKPKSQQDAAPPEKSPDLYEYYDSGNHWCKNCNTVCGSMFDFFTHLYSKSHRKTLDPYDRPWASNASTKEKKRPQGEKIVRPAKGCEFVIPVRGFFCQLCEEFFGDQICAEEHVTCHSHNEKYKKRMDEHPMYEQRRNLDRQAGLSVATDSRDRKHSELKRKLEVEVPATRECKSASPGEEPPPKHKERRSHDSREEKSASYKEETSSSRREEKAQRRQEDRPYSGKEEKRSSAKDEKEVRKKTPPREVKAEPLKPEEVPEKPPPKVICGPSPSILAKVRKRNEEAVKNASSTTAFGKFSWKKSEKEKEEEKEMANILGEEEDEDDGEGQDDPKGTFAKAKAIAIKLSGKTVIPPSNPWLPLSSAQSAPAKIRPTLLAPKMVLRKSTTSATSKPAPLNTFLSIKPTSSSNGKPLPVVKPPAKKETVLTPDLISKAFGGQEVVLKTPEVPVKPTPAPEKIQSPSTDIKKPPAQTKAVAQPPEPPPPGMNLMSFESDLAAPGVPAGEISMPVLVCPPPLHMTEGPRKSDKPKSNLAAAKAQDLYDIFYSGGAKSASDRLAGTKQPKGGEAPKSKDSTAPKTEDRSETGDAQKDCGDGKDPEISKAEKDAPYPQLDMEDMDIFAYNFE